MANLLEKASIIHAPAGYGVGCIGAIKPEFKVIDTELLINNTFDTTGDWNTSGGKWQVNGDGYAVYDSDTTSGDANLTQTNAMVLGETYIVKVVIDSFDNGGSDGFLGLRNPTTSTVEQMSSAGTYHFYIKALATTFAVRAVYNTSTTLKISISEFSLKQINEADLTFDRGTSATQTRTESDGDIATVGQDIPRIDYSGGVGHWLFEPQSTNTATYSNDFTQGVIFDGGTGPQLQNDATLASNQGISPDGTNNAWKLGVGTTAESFTHLRLTNMNVISNNINVISLFAKKGSGVDWFGIFADGYDGGNQRAWFDLENGVKGTRSGGLNHTMEDYGDGWYRCSFTFSSTTDLIGNIRLVITDSDSSSTYTGTLTDHHLMFGLQGESTSTSTNNYPTSYIPTNGGIETRDTEIAINAGYDGLFGQTEGVLYAEVAVFDTTSADRVIEVSNGSSSSNLRISFRSNGKFQIRGAMSSTLAIDHTSTAYNANQFYKVALKYKSGENAAWIDGVEVKATTNTYTPIDTIDVLNLQAFNGNVPFYGKIKCIAVFPEALTDAELQCLTTTSANQILGEYKIYVERSGGVYENEPAMQSTLNELT